MEEAEIAAKPRSCKCFRHDTCGEDHDDRRVHTTRPAYSATMRSPFLSLLVLCIIVGTSLASTVDVLQVHLAFGGGSDMVVSWGVPNTTDVASYVPAVMYGEDPSALSSTASAPTPEHVR